MIEEIPVSNLKRFEGMYALGRYTFLGAGILFVVAQLVSFFVLTEFFEDPLRYMSIPLILWFAGPLIFITYAVYHNTNLYPTIWTGDEGIYVSFNFGRVFVPWGDVIGIREKRFFFENNRIYLRKTTKPHSIFGLHHWSKFSIIQIDPTMRRDTYDELLDEIEKYVLDSYL